MCVKHTQTAPVDGESTLAGRRRHFILFIPCIVTIGYKLYQQMHCYWLICSYIAILYCNMFRHLLGIVILFVILTFKCIPEDDPNRGRNMLEHNIVI
jgi:putative effector of murein hydrolase LrgA (UPF0299 family)